MNPQEETKIIKLPSKELDSVKPKKQELTIEDIKAIPKFASCSDEQAQEIIDFLKELARIAYKIHENQLVIFKNGTDIANKGKTKVVSLHESKKRAA